jgi:hypothetical protein
MTATGGKTFAYDSQNELVSMGGTASLVYDAEGNRVAKSVSGAVTRYLVDGLNPTGYPQAMQSGSPWLFSRTNNHDGDHHAQCDHQGICQRKCSSSQDSEYCRGYKPQYQ